MYKHKTTIKRRELCVFSQHLFPVTLLCQAFQQKCLIPPTTPLTPYTLVLHTGYRKATGNEMKYREGWEQMKLKDH